MVAWSAQSDAEPYARPAEKRCRTDKYVIERGLGQQSYQNGPECPCGVDVNAQRPEQSAPEWKEGGDPHQRTG